MEPSPSNKRDQEQAELTLNDDFKRQKISLIIDPDEFICPITKQIFREPVLCDDGFTYEKDAIEELLSNSSKSPMTRTKISRFFENKMMMLNIEKFLSENSSYKTLQYVGLSCSYPKNLRKAIDFLKNNNFEEFSKYTDVPFNKSFIMDGENTLIMERICRYCVNLNQFDRILSNCVDLNIKSNNGCTLMYYIAKYCPGEFIDLAMKKGMPIMNLNNDRESLIGIMTKRPELSTNDILEIILKVLDREHNLLVLNKKNERDITFIMQKFKNDNDSLEILKCNKKIFPFMVFHFPTISDIFESETFDNIREFLSTLETDINRCVTDGLVESYFENYILEYTTFGDARMIGAINGCFDCIEKNGLLSNVQKKCIADIFNNIFVIKLNIYDLWLELVSAINLGYHKRQKEKFIVMQAKWT
jgi:hypothetical protein